MKHVAVVIRQTPFNTCRNSEALRMTVGLTLADHGIAVIFRDDSVYPVTDATSIDGSSRSIISRHSSSSTCVLIAERESLTERHLSHLKWDVERLGQREVITALGESDAIICF
jgi:sulfur relay (sulfurtransferase) DsrF/TusC family protein